MTKKGSVLSFLDQYIGLNIRQRLTQFHEFNQCVLSDVHVLIVVDLILHAESATLAGSPQQLFVEFQEILTLLK